MAIELGADTKYAEGLGPCNARFEIGIYDTEESLSNPETLLRISTLLQQLTSGYSYQTWTQQLTPPQ